MNAFIFLVMKILLTTGSSSTSEIVSVYARNGNVSFCLSKPAKRFPNGNCVGAFGGLCQGRMIIGFEKNVYEYMIEPDEWRQIQKERDVKCDRTFASCCSMEDYLLAIAPGLENRCELMHFKDNVAELQLNETSTTTDVVTYTKDTFNSTIVSMSKPSSSSNGSFQLQSWVEIIYLGLN